MLASTDFGTALIQDRVSLLEKFFPKDLSLFIESWLDFSNQECYSIQPNDKESQCTVFSTGHNDLFWICKWSTGRLKMEMYLWKFDCSWNLIKKQNLLHSQIIYPHNLMKTGFAYGNLIAQITPAKFHFLELSIRNKRKRFQKTQIVERTYQPIVFGTFMSPSLIAFLCTNKIILLNSNFQKKAHYSFDTEVQMEFQQLYNCLQIVGVSSVNGRMSICLWLRLDHCLYFLDSSEEDLLVFKKKWKPSWALGAKQITWKPKQNRFFVVYEGFLRICSDSDETLVEICWPPKVSFHSWTWHRGNLHLWMSHDAHLYDYVFRK